MTAAFFFSIVANDFARFAFLRQIWLQGNDWRLYSVLWIVSVMVKNCFCTHDAAWPSLECKERDMYSKDDVFMARGFAVLLRLMMGDD